MFGSLFYEFDIKGGKFARYFYVFFVLRRLLYCLNLMLMGAFPVMQSLINIFLALGSLGYLVAVKPYSESILQVTNTVSELGCFAVFGLVNYFLGEDLNYEKQVEEVIIYTTLAVMGVQVLASVLIFFQTIAELVKRRRTRNNAIVEELEIEETTDNYRALEFFRGRKVGA